MICEHIRRMHAYVPGEQPREPGIIKLNTNENPYPPCPGVIRLFSEFDPSRLRLYPDPSCTALRARVAELHGVSADQVLIGNGSDEVLALCTRAFVERDGFVGCFNPSYSLYPVLANIRNVRCVSVELDDGFGWPAGFSGRTAGENAARSVFFITNPNAPTGMLFPRAEVERFCREFPGTVVIDEAYVDFAPADCMDLARERDNVLVMRTLSKSYALAGLRLGYAVGHPALIGAMHTIRDSYNLGMFEQALGLAALTDTEYMRAQAARIIRSRERLRAGLAAAGFLVFPSATNFLWARPPALPAKELFERLRARRILVRYFPDPRIRDYVRITVGTDAQVDALLAAVNEGMAG